MAGHAWRKSVSDQPEQSALPAARDLSDLSEDREESLCQSMEPEYPKTNRIELAGQRELSRHIHHSSMGELRYRSSHRHARCDTKQLRFPATVLLTESRPGP